MQIAILSDIHGNYEAFNTCIDFCEKRNITEYIFLGDYLGEFAYPEKTMQLLYSLREKYKCTFIRGNKEEYWINPKAWRSDKWKEYDSTTGCLYYVINRLNKEDIDFFAEMPISKTINYPQHEAFTICHGSPFNNREKMLPEDEATARIIERCDTKLIFCGHTHKQRMMEYGDVKICNPGAVGVPIYSGGKTQFAILNSEDDSWNIEFISLKYDVEEVVRQQIEAGIDKKAPYWWKTTNQLLHGSIYSLAEVLFKAMDCTRISEGECNWPVIPEKYWQQAYEEIFGKDELISHDVMNPVEMKDYPVCLESKLIHDTKWMSLYCDKVQMPNGSIIDTYYKVMIPKESVAVVVVNEEGKILLIQSKRYTTSRMEWEIPAGSVENGECIEQAARRECMEETGCKLKKLTYMTCTQTCNGLNDLTIHYFLAQVTGMSELYDGNEVGERRWVSKEEVLKLIKNTNTKSGISAQALMHAILFYL